MAAMGRVGANGASYKSSGLYPERSGNMFGGTGFQPVLA